MALWIGSLWGDDTAHIRLSALVFSIVWAIILITVAVWAARENWLWIVNMSMVFGAIHFYTQFFERMGASPGSMATAGVSSLLFLFWIRDCNKTSIADKTHAETTNKKRL
jgi:hypothetical protein